jgi:hypothetical protein
MRSPRRFFVASTLAISPTPWALVAQLKFIAQSLATEEEHPDGAHRGDSSPDFSP